MRTQSIVVLVMSLVLVAATASSPARGAIVTYDLGFEYSGATPPAGAGPWLRATFDDGGSPGAVTLTLTALNLTGGEFVNDWMFNLDPALNPKSLSFAMQSSVGTFAPPVVLVGSDEFGAAGGTDFDIDIDFDNAPPANRFGAGESAQLLITGIPTLTAGSFNFLSSLGGQGPFFTAAHVQGIGAGGNDSGWVVPEPTSLGLLALSATMLVRRRRA